MGEDFLGEEEKEVTMAVLPDSQPFLSQHMLSHDGSLIVSEAEGECVEAEGDTNVFCK